MARTDGTSLENGARCVWDSTRELVRRRRLRKLLAAIDAKAEEEDGCDAKAEKTIVLEGCEKHMPDGSIEQKTRATSMAQLRADHKEHQAAKKDLRRILCARPSVDVEIAARRAYRKRLAAIDRRVKSETKTTIVPSQRVSVSLRLPAPISVPAVATTVGARPREHRAASRTRCRVAGGGADDGPEPPQPPLAERACTDSKGGR